MNKRWALVALMGNNLCYGVFDSTGVIPSFQIIEGRGRYPDLTEDTMYLVLATPDKNSVLMSNIFRFTLDEKFSTLYKDENFPLTSLKLFHQCQTYLRQHDLQNLIEE